MKKNTVWVINKVGKCEIMYMLDWKNEWQVKALVFFIFARNIDIFNQFTKVKLKFIGYFIVIKLWKMNHVLNIKLD